MKESYFDGRLIQLIGWSLLGWLITTVTFGICAPWAFCMIYRWDARHTVVEGKRLQFEGRAIGLWGKWLLWMLLTIVTIGIFSLWIPIKLRQWKTKNLRFQTAAAQ